MKKYFSLLLLLLCGCVPLMAQSEQPTFSTADKPVYFNIVFKTGGCHLQDNGVGEWLTIKNAKQSSGQRFALIGNKNSFLLLSDKGNYVGLKSEGQDQFFCATNQTAATALTLLNSNGYFEMAKTTDKTKAMNQWQGAQDGHKLGLWKTGDINNPLAFVDPNTVTEYEVQGLSHFTPQHPLTLWYDRPATLTGVANVWMEYSLPIGNGALGASLFGGVKTDEIQFNEKTVWTGGPNDMGSYGKYLNFGNLYVKNLNDVPFTNGKTVHDYVRFLDIEQGISGVNFTDGDGTAYTRRYFSSQPDGVIAVRYTANGANKLHLLFSVKAGEETNAGTPTYTADGYGYFQGKLTTVSHHLRFKVVPVGGTLIRSDKGLEVKDATEVLLVLCGGTTFDSNVAGRSRGTVVTLGNNIKKTVDAAVTKGWDSLLADHVANFTSFMGRVQLNLNNAASNRNTEELIKFYNASESNKQSTDGIFLEQLYFNYGRYLAISSSRGNINVPSNLQGIWNNVANAPWNSDIHTNINVQMNYWPAEPTNLSDCHLPFLDYIIDNAKSANWKAAAKRGGQDKGWTVFTESNIFGGMSTWGSNYFVANAWYATHLWQHYRYTLDRDYLKRAFPAMWGSAQFWMGRMIKDRKVNDGKWVCPDEYSPEQNDHPKEDATAHAQQLVMDNLTNCLSAIEVLGTKDAKVTEAELNTLKDYIKNTDTGLHLETYKGDWGSWATNNGIKTGDKLLKEWKYTPYSVSNDKGHRHMSHLMCLYPLNQVQQGDAYFQAAVNALKLRGDAATGWSMGWKVNLWARAKDGDHARKIIKNALRHSTSYGTDQYAGGIYYNLYDSHAPFQIDGNFGVCAGIAELLMQSQNNFIDILPALPTAWKNGSIKGLKAVGNFTVDIEWQNGKPTKVNITSHKGTPLRIAAPALHAVEVKVDGKGAEVVAEELEEGRPAIYRINNVAAGSTVSIDFSRPALPTSIGRLAATAPNLTYDLAGRRVSRDAHGVLIVGGRKVVK